MNLDSRRDIEVSLQGNIAAIELNNIINERIDHLILEGIVRIDESS